ncbi:MAG: hypothetical protein JWP88_1579 [Flaviaesturariibacter sp.]|nr:hypothetical protein [Flaviaesturariibacter sp.]
MSFASLPAYARYLLTERIDELVRLQRRLSIDYEMPLVQAFVGLPEEEQHCIGVKYATELLSMLSENKAKEHIQNSISNWKANTFPLIDKYTVAAEDITKMTFIRKKAFLQFLPEYTTEPAEMLAVIEELDAYLMHFELASSSVLIELVEERLAMHNHFIGQINNTLPGALYIFDLQLFQNVYANDKLEAIIGYTREEMNALGTRAITQITHPDDAAAVWAHLDRCRLAKDGEILSYKYRVRQKEGHYKWIRNYESVFKRDAQGAPTELIAISLDVDQEKRMAEQLKHNESLYRHAERLSNIGSWQWNAETDALSWTDQLFKIYGLEPGSETITLERFLSFVHPDDRKKIEAEVQAGFPNEFADYTFRIVTATGEIKNIRSIAEVSRNAAGKVISVIGTEQDVTERQHLIEKLQEKEALYQQAQSIAQMGNWSWDIATNKVEWSTELYRVFGLSGDEEITFEKYASLLHPEDRETVMQTIQASLKSLEPYDFYHRIVISGEPKIIHSRGEVLYKDGVAYKLIGTGQDVTEWKKLIEQLQRSERLYQQAQSLARLGNWTMDLQTREFHWSDEMFAIYEIDNTERFNEESWYKWVHPEDRDEVKAYLQDCIAQKKVYDKVHRLVLRDGKIKTVHRKGEFIFNIRGEAVEMFGTTQDVTEQFRVQKELQERQRFIQKITDATPSVIASYNVGTGQYSFVSEGLQKLLGYKTQEVYEKGIGFFIDIIHPDDMINIAAKNAESLEEANRSAGSQEPVREFEYRMRHKDGSYRWFHTYGTVFNRDSQGKVEEVLNISLDITEQKQATQKISDQEHFIEQVAEASPTILYLFDVAQNAFAYLNREIFFVLGYTPEEIMAMDGHSITELYHPDDRKLLPERVGSESHFQYAESMMQYECRLKNKAGEWCWFLVREVIFKKDDTGAVQQILGAALDIDKRKEMERTLLQNAFQLKQSNNSLEEFAYVASHDLKEPLRKISTFGDRLAATQMEKMGEDGKLYLKKVIDASQRMQIMIDDLLSVSMISGNRKFESHSLQHILEDAKQAVETKLEQKSALIKAGILPEAVIVASQFRQLFQNLLSNSLKFVREGVQPVITITHSYPSVEELEKLNLAKAKPYLQLVFQDNGIGFDNESAGKIFQIFHRLHGRSEYEGTGIGLAICKKIVEHHGGVIYAAGVPGEGATFTILLPQ